MPGTRRRASAAAAVAAEDPEEHDETNGLHFNEALTWRAGRPIPVADLLRRLQALSQELRGLDQEEAERESLLPIAKQLASQNLLGHKDRGVRAWAACCIVDMFKLCAPDAPYTGSQLKDIFTMIINTILPALSDPSSPYNSQHVYVLKSLAEVKSIVLVTDIPSANNLILALCTACFDVLSQPSKSESGEELSKNVEHYMTKLLIVLVDEAQSLPAEAVDVILAQFLRADPRVLSGGSKSKKGAQYDERQSTLLLKEAPPAYNMAMNICNSLPEKMARLISQYFSSVIVDATSVPIPLKTSKNRSKRMSSVGADSDDEAPRQPTEDDLNESRKVHRLLRELWRSSPLVLQDIIPQLDAELSAEDVQLRNLATETLGDIISGIGAAGPPPPPTYNPSAYPSQSLSPPSERLPVYNFLTTPTSPQSFASSYHQVYESFLSRRNDKSPAIRAAWTTAIGRILSTNAGGVGLDEEDQQRLLKLFGEMLVDGDERVRLAAVKSVERFGYHDIVQKLGIRGSAAESESILSNLADRVKDRKPAVRTEATKLLAKIWGVAAGAIAEGSERVGLLLGPIPSRILEAYFLNDKEVNVLIDRILFEELVPLSYPDTKRKRGRESQANGDVEYTEADVDKIRVERILVLIRDLLPRPKLVLFAKQTHQVVLAKYMDALLKKCEEFNGGVMESRSQEIEQHLGRLIDYHAKMLPETSRASEDLWKFAKMHDRRCYALIRFCIATDSDYRRVRNSIRELTKRIEEATGSSATLLDTLIPLVYRSSILLYNKNHVPAIIQFSRTDEKGLGSTAHEVLKEISSKNPDVFRGYVEELCKVLESEAPTAKKPNRPGAVDDLKACAGFARRFPKDVPTDRKFIKAMLSFAQFGSPPKAAKYGVSIIMACTDKKEMHARDLLKQCTEGFEYGKGNYLARLAALSQLMLLGSKAIEDEIDPVIDIAIDGVLLRSTPADAQQNPDWTDEPDEDCAAKMWALKILVNRLRGLSDDESINQVSEPVYKLLNTLVSKHGELSRKIESPVAQKSRLRLLASELLLKLCCEKRFDALLTPRDFNELATVIQDPHAKVRDGFVRKLMKYLGQDKLPKRFYTIVFLGAFEPDSRIKTSTFTWLKARQAAFSKAHDHVLEDVFARFLSVLAHHPDFDTEVENLRDVVTYLLFYLKAVANEDSISLIYHQAQRVKAVEDAIDPARSESLYVLSDLAQAVIQRYRDLFGWNIQAVPKKARMPADVFANLPSHERAQEIAEKQHVPEELVDELDDLVRAAVKGRKQRKSETTSEQREKKRARASSTFPTRKAPKAAKIAKTPKKRKEPLSDNVASGDRRRSGRNLGGKNYAESSQGEDEEMDDAQDQENESGDEIVQEDGPVEEENEHQSDVDDVEEQETPAQTPKSTQGKSKTAAAKSEAPKEKKAPAKAIKSKTNGATPTRRSTRGKPPPQADDAESDDDALSDPPDSDDEQRL
ncbi:armadillo-type protein [Phyllosticta citriasiana]|uniref:Armadillo-type protein n=1 Tax=Phyllosticta citriasiana TaxID=595635 RepID=A0ABR1KL48_9PEZI